MTRTLSDAPALRLAAFTLLYVAQGLPYGIFIVAIPAWLAARGAGLDQVAGFTAFVSLPWSFKLVAAPLIDRVRFPALGLRRPWVLLAQAGIFASWLVVAGAPANADVAALAWLGFMLNAFTATQDVAVDSMAIDLLQPNERARANSLMFAGQTAGIGAASWGGARVLNAYGMSAAALLMAAATLLILLVPLLLRERPGEKLLPWTAGAATVLPDAARQHANTGAMLRALLRALLLPACAVILLTQVLERVGGGMLGASWANFGHDVLGWGAETYPGWATVSTLLTAVVPPLLAPLIDRLGYWQTYAGAALLKLALFAAAAALPALWVQAGVVPGLLLAAQLLASLASVAAVSLAMNGCRPAVAATQFALCMAAFNLAQSIGGAAAAQLAAAGFGYATLFACVAGANFIVLLVALVGSRQRWQLPHEGQ